MKLSIAMLGLICVSVSAFAADIDYSRIKKDVNVMSQILRSAFDQDDHRHPGLDVEGNYLAKQGAVFTIDAPRFMRGFSINIGDGDNDVLVMRGSDRIVSIPEIDEALSDAMEDLEDELEDLDNFHFEWIGEPGMYNYEYNIEDRIRLDRETRAAMREISREMRDIERQISENRLELIHEDDEGQRAELEREIDELTRELEATQEKREKLESRLEEERRKVEQKRAEVREKMRAAREEQMALVEKTVMQSLCDYGATLKNLPRDEHVSVIMETHAGDEDRRIYVFDQADVTDCRSGPSELVSKATQYMF